MCGGGGSCLVEANYIIMIQYRYIRVAVLSSACFSDEVENGVQQ